MQNTKLTMQRRIKLEQKFERILEKNRNIQKQTDPSTWLSLEFIRTFHECRVSNRTLLETGLCMMKYADCKLHEADETLLPEITDDSICFLYEKLIDIFSQSKLGYEKLLKASFYTVSFAQQKIFEK